MKLWQSLLFSLLVIKSANSENVNLVARAISEIIDKDFVKKSERIEIISVAFGRQKNFDVTNDVVRLQQETDAYPIEMRHVDLTQNWDRYLNKSAIIFLDSPEAFYAINATMKLGNKLPKTFKILVYNEKLADELIGLSIAKELKLSLTFAKISFLKTRNGVVELNAFYFFEPEACRLYTSKTINKFSGSLQKWETRNFFSTTIDNFNGCELNIGYDLPYILQTHGIRRFSRNGQPYLSGPLCATIFKLSNHLNYIHSSADPADSDFDYKISPLHDYEISRLNNHPIHITTTFQCSDLIVITTLGEHYTPLEKMLIPFDNETWIGIGVVALGALIVIFAAEHAPIQIRHFLFGRKLRTPAINMLIGIMGGSQVVMPKRLWARILLTIYLFMCLIIRNAYQQKTFEYLVGDGRKPAPRSLAELVQKNYTLYMNRGSAFMIEALEPSRRPRMFFLKKHREVHDLLYEKPKDPKFKAAVLLSKEEYSTQVESNLLNGTDFLWQPLEETIFTAHEGLPMTPNNYLFDTFDQGIKKLLPTGMLEKGDIELEEPRYKQQEEDPPKKVLSMADLELGFKIWFICLAIAFAVFILEHVKFYLFDRKREKKKKQTKQKLERRNAIRRKVKETAIVVEDLEDLVVQTINEFDANLPRCTKRNEGKKLRFKDDQKERVHKNVHEVFHA